MWDRGASEVCRIRHGAFKGYMLQRHLKKVEGDMDALRDAQERMTKDLLATKTSCKEELLSEYISIDISSIVIVVLALVTFSLRTYINIGTGIFVAGIFILTTIFLALIFVPKVLHNSL